ncbi:MAG: ATP-binding protein [Candidatus Omnitrophota bacterium]
MNPFTITCIISFVLAFSVGSFIFLKGKEKDISKFVGLSFIFPAIWCLGAYKFSTSLSEETALFWIKIAHIGIILTPAFYSHFIFRLVKNHRRSLLILIYLLAILFILLSFFYKNFINVTYSFNQFYFFNLDLNKNPTYLIFYLLLYVAIVFYDFLLILRFFATTTGFRRNQIKYMIIGSIIAWLAPQGMFLYIIFGLPIYPYSNVLLGVYPVVIAYAILKYRLMDIRVAMTRAGIFIAVYTLILGLPFAIAFKYQDWLTHLWGASWWMSPLLLMAALATVGPFIYIYIDKRAEEKLLSEQRKYQKTLKEASVGMTRIRDLRRLLDMVAHIITHSVKISYVAVYLFDEHTNDFSLQISRDKGRISIPRVSTDNPLIAWLMVMREPLIYDEIKRKAEESNDSTYAYLEENMRKLTASVLIPSFLEDRFVGFFVLGEKVSGQIYTPEDLDVFQVLASQAALAIENAQFYEEAKQMQEQIAHAEKMATIGTMADGLSHQINNRFYALSLIAGDTIDTIKITDTSKCTPEIKEMVTSISRALERIQVNVMQGGEVVRGLLKYSRDDDIALEAIDLNKLLDNTLEMVLFKVKLSEIDFIRNFSEDIPKIKGNMVQLQEAFFNFIDNAYDAIVERRNTLKEEGYRGMITVSAQAKDKAIEITLEDNGIGVKEENTEKIFTPFFTTKATSRKGTGLGLYVIRRILTDHHKGKISFESHYKVGTRFIIELPVAV